ncbi:MAG TPA: Wzz/FepE/Etk N-terminal domain-containing protein [Anaerolineae bacterium]|nr:hypothetical protein [Anaerolineae bacterium]MCB9079310.1 hypothetical protein [Anaerolineaceae bacterium]HRV92747.1 Wzz/FepE/Etk N-terminal domain-containing protein [Anaerolineae bacterium]
MQARDFMQYLKIIRKWWWVIALLFVATVGTMLVISVIADKEYEATVTVQVSAPPPEEAPLYSQFGREALSDEIEQARTSFRQLLENGDVAFRTLEQLPDIEIGSRELRDEKMTVDTLNSVQLLHISVRADDPDTAALLANKVVEVGLERYGDLRAQSTANTIEFIDEQLRGAQEELKTAEFELSQFQIANKIGTLNRAMDNQYSLIRSLEIEDNLARSEGDTVKAKALNEMILEREVELQNMIGLSSDYVALEDRVERARKNYNYLLDRLTEGQIKVNQIREVGFIQIITPAWPPSDPVVLISGRMLALGVIASLIGGVLLTFLLEYLEISGTFRSSTTHESKEKTDIGALPDSVH